jgi:hypothetical protein
LNTEAAYVIARSDGERFEVTETEKILLASASHVVVAELEVEEIGRICLARPWTRKEASAVLNNEVVERSLAKDLVALYQVILVIENLAVVGMIRVSEVEMVVGDQKLVTSRRPLEADSGQIISVYEKYRQEKEEKRSQANHVVYRAR